MVDTTKRYALAIAVAIVGIVLEAIGVLIAMFRDRPNFGLGAILVGVGATLAATGVLAAISIVEEEGGKDG